MDPDQIEDIEIAPNLSENGFQVVEANTTIFLTCNLTVGKPPRNVHWCVRKWNETNFSDVFINLPEVNTSAATFNGETCQNRRKSTLMYNVGEDDLYTTFLCEDDDDTLDTLGCGNGTVQALFNISIGKNSNITEHTALYIINQVKTFW